MGSTASSDMLPPPAIHHVTEAEKELAGSGAFWFLTWFILNIVVTLMNKAFFSFWSFPYPATLSAIHMAFTAVYSSWWISATMQAKISTPNERWSIARLSVLFTANIFVGNSCLLYASVSLVQTVRSIIPGITVVLSMIMLHKRYQFRHFQAVFFVVVGVALAACGEMQSASIGLALTLLVCVLSSLKSVLSAKYLSSLKQHPMQILSQMASYACIQMLAVACWYGELDAIGAAWRDENTDLVYVALVLALNGTMAFLLNYANFATTKKTSALTVTVGGNLKHVATIIFSVLIFQNPITALNAIGIVLATFGAAAYSYVEYADKQAGRNVAGSKDSSAVPVLAVSLEPKQSNS